MSALLPHIKAARALAEAFAFEGNESRDVPASRVLLGMSAAYSRAADAMEERARSETGGEAGSTWTPPPIEDKRKR